MRNIDNFSITDEDDEADRNKGIDDDANNEEILSGI